MTRRLGFKVWSLSCLWLLSLFALSSQVSALPWHAAEEPGGTTAGALAEVREVSAVPLAQEAGTDATSEAAPSLLRRSQGLLGIVCLLGLCYAFSRNRKAVRLRIILWGLSLQLVFAFAILKTPVGKGIFEKGASAVTELLSYTHQGSYFLFGDFYVGRPDLYQTLEEDIHATDPTRVGPYTVTVPRGVDDDGDGTFDRTVDSPEPMGTVLLFHVLPTIIFFSALMSLLYHLGVIQIVVRSFAYVMSRTMGTSGSESLSAAANIFVGQTEAPLVVKPFVSKMTTSELMAIMVGGFATIAGGVLALYMSFVGESLAGHLIAASVMAAPCGLVVAKILEPETQVSETSGSVPIHVERKTANVIDAIASGTIDGLRLMLNVAAMLLVFMAMVAMVNAILSSLFGTNLFDILGVLFRPVAFAIGVSWDEADKVGNLLGTKIVLNELIAYSRLQGMEGLSEHAKVISTYALCGFANFASVGIQIGGISGIAPERRGDLAKLGFKAMLGGAVATCVTASIAGILY